MLKAFRQVQQKRHQQKNDVWRVTFGWLMVMALAGCNLAGDALPTPNEDNVIFVTATVPLPTPNEAGEIIITATPEAGVIAQVPTSELPPTVVPTGELPATIAPTTVAALTSAPDETLQRANMRLLQGYYEEAIADYELILAQGEGVTDELRAQAAYQAGRAALRDGLFGDALGFFNALIEQFPQASVVNRAYFLRGDAHLGLGQWQAAIADFERYLVLMPNLIDSYVHERIADAHLALGNTDDALARYTLALNAQRTLVPELALREKVAQILLRLGRTSEAVAQYDAILAVAQNAPYRAQMELAATRALINAGDIEAGITRARRIFDTYPTTASAHSALQIMLDQGVSIDGFARGRVLYYFGDYNGAISAFNEYSSNYELAAIPAELYLLLGRSYREIGNSQAAQVAFTTLTQQYVGDALFGDALLEQGRTHFLAGDVATAIQTYLRIGDNFGYLTATAAEALWRAGYLYGVNDDPFQSRQVFMRLAESYPQSSWASNGLFLAASAAVKNEENVVAENLYGRIASLSTGDDQAAAYYWVGRLASERGDPGAASQAFALARSAAPESYFAARAVDILEGVRPFEPPSQVRFVFDEASERAETEAWLRATFGITEAGDLGALSAELASDARLIRGTELWSVGAFEEAQREFSALLQERRAVRDALAAYQLALYLRDLGALYWSIVAAADVINAAGVGTLEAPSFIARMRFPAYFHELINAEATRYGFDPLLMLALIRQESLFNTAAISTANAKGLTQVIPSTGRYIASQLGRTNYEDSDLWRPYVSIAFGSFYLDEQLRLFRGNVAAALAAYNAGPGRALDWVALAGGDVDLLVTTITFEETRRYVQRIYSHYNIYRALYGG